MHGRSGAGRRCSAMFLSFKVTAIRAISRAADANAKPCFTGPTIAGSSETKLRFCLEQVQR